MIRFEIADEDLQRCEADECMVEFGIADPVTGRTADVMMTVRRSDFALPFEAFAARYLEPAYAYLRTKVAS